MATLPAAFSLWCNKGGKQYQLRGACSRCVLEEQSGQLAESLSIELANVLADGTYIGSVLDPGDILYLSCDDGDRKGELFHGPIWTQDFRQESQSLSITCYDPLIYMQSSQDALFFPSGKNTQSIFQTICSRWKIPLHYTYSSITHGMKAWMGNQISDMFLELLKETKAKSGKSYRMRYENNALDVAYRGSNTTIYELRTGQNATAATFGRSMENVVTRVLITGKEDKNGNAPVEATLDGQYAYRYGTLQRVQARDSNTSLAAAKSTAEQMLFDNKLPGQTFAVDAVDCPFLRRGDLVHNYTSANGSQIKVSVASVSHDLIGCTMNLELET
jgi:hypothetical protein